MSITPAPQVEMVSELPELLKAAIRLREAQRAYLADPVGERSNEKGRQVGVAADELDIAIQAALNARAGGDDSARLGYVLGKVFFDRRGACLPCGNTKIDVAMRNDSIRNIDAALASQAVGVGS